MSQPSEEYFLYPGDFHFSNKNVRLHTLLGSCIAISLWHPKKRIGGLCHFVLPSHPKDGPAAIDGRYGDDCIKLFKRAAQREKTELKEYQAKIFGGGNLQGRPNPLVLDSNVKLSDTVGERNTQAAIEFLLAENIHIAVAHVGEFGYRRIYFDVNTGCVWVKFTPSTQAKPPDTLSGNV